MKLNYKDVLIPPKITNIDSRSKVQLESKKIFKFSRNNWQGIPIIASNMDYVGTFETAIELQKNNILTAISKYYSDSEWAKAISSGVDMNYSFITFGLENPNKILDKIHSIEDLTNQTFKMVMFDIANGYIIKYHNMINEIRKHRKDLILAAGNIVTKEGVKAISEAGADLVKIGIGSGSVCDTSTVTGIGYPQFSAVDECSNEAVNLGVKIIADGGITSSGDIVKSFVAGADFVMLGSLLAGHEQGGSPIKEINGKKHRQFYGMSSEQAMSNHESKKKSYRASEGSVKWIENKGDINRTIEEILGGLRSACTYLNVSNLDGINKDIDYITVK